MTEISGGDARENARIAREVLGGANGAHHEIVAANAGAALYVSGAATTIREGVEMARESISSGQAMTKLQELVAVTNELA
jgi:anthranilate phosphoribosyltransferase